MTPEGWREVGLTDVAHLEMGETLIAKDLSGDGIPVFSASRDPAPWGYTSLSKKVFGRGTIILGARGTIGYPRLPRFDRFVSTQTTIAVTPSTSILPDFLKRALDRVNFDEITAKQAIPMLTIAALRELRLVVPQLSEQRKIAVILSAVDDAIEGTQAVIDQLQVVKKAMMAELLTRGLPGRHTQFKKTEIGEIPVGWDIARMESISIVITKGESPGWQGFEYQDAGVLFVTSENVRDGFLDLDKPKFIPSEFARKIARSRLVPGDVLVNIVGASIGRAALWRGEYPEANVNQAVAVVRPDPEKLVSRLLLDALYGPRGQAYFGTSKVDNARPNVSLTNLRDFVMVVPPADEQREIAGLGDALDARLRAESDAHSTLTETKAALMSVLLTGELRVTPDEATP